MCRNTVYTYKKRDFKPIIVVILYLLLDQAPGVFLGRYRSLVSTVRFKLTKVSLCAAQSSGKLATHIDTFHSISHIRFVCVPTARQLQTSIGNSVDTIVSVVAGVNSNNP